METITEKTTVKGTPEKIVKDSGSVNERVQYLRFWARSLLSLCVFGIYFYDLLFFFFFFLILLLFSFARFFA